MENSRPFVWLLARTWIRKNTDCFAVYIWSVCGNTDNKEYGFVHFSSITSNFFDNACTKIQNMAFRTSRMDQIALVHWCNSFLWRLRVDRRGFFHQRPILEKRFPRPDIKIPHMRRSESQSLSTCLSSGSGSAAFRTNYDVTSFNTWKSVCCKYSRSRNLLLAGNCCYWDFLSAAGVIRSYRFWK